MIGIMFNRFNSVEHLALEPFCSTTLLLLNRMATEMLKRHSTLAHSAYIDLKRIIKDDTISDLRGSIELDQRGDHTYVFDRYRVGTKVQRRYIGALDDELQERIDRHEEIRAQRESGRKERSRLVRLLRGETVKSVDGETGKLLRAFDRGAVLVGAAAFALYEGELGVQLGTVDETRTLDIDIASFRRLSIAIDETADLAGVFSELEFEPVPGLERQPWRWKQSEGDTLIEFLTPYTTGGAEQERIVALGVEARALQFMQYLLTDTIDAVAIYQTGVLVRVPDPARFAIHKLIVANERLNETGLKAEKDRRQARMLMNVLAEDRPDELIDAYNEALGMGDRWREATEASLRKMPGAAELLS